MPKYPPAVAHDFSLRAADLLRKRRDQEAHDLLEDITGPNEGSATDWFHRGIAEERLKHHEQALAAYRRALEIEPGYFRCLAALSGLEWRRMQWRSARRHLLRALKADLPPHLQSRRS